MKKPNTLLLGSCLALFSAAAFALNLVLARISYEHGANVHSQNLVRSLLFLGFLGIYIAATDTSFSLPFRARMISLLVGVLLCAEMYVLLGAIAAIPVALSVLIFYTYPILIGAMKWISGEEKFKWLSLILMAAGFSGLVFVLISTPPSQINLTGVALSIAAAVVMAAMLTTSEYNLVRHDNQVVLFYSLLMTAAIISAASLTIVEVHWPAGQFGWTVFFISAIFYVLATFTLFKAVSMVGPLRTAIIDNTAPVWAIVFGYLLLSQTLSAKQIGGSVTVVLAVMLLQLTHKKPKSK